MSSTKRDAILEIQREAALGNFDILLVFMFDRLGRRDDETPFVVEWFIRNNIAVWSVNEGEQRLDSHVDKLLNYIRYWQASGESIKTSIRVKAGRDKIVKEGYYAGGWAPLGYRLEKCGRINANKGKEALDFVVDDEAAETVRTIFNLYVNEGYGGTRLLRYLHEQGVVKTNGKPLSQCNIYTLLSNTLYIGYITYGDIKTFVPRLKIMDDDLFNRAQELRKMRRRENNGIRRIPRTTKAKSLLSGNIFCGHCGGRMWFSNGNASYKKVNGEVTHYNAPAYCCYYGINRGGITCQQKYTTKRVDKVIRSVLQRVFEQIRDTPPAVCLESQHEKHLEVISNHIKTITRSISKLNKELSGYQSEVIKVIQGESAFTADVLNQLIHKTEDKLSKQTAELERLKSELAESDSLCEKTKEEYMRIRSWAEIFDESSIETQKMVTAHLINEVRLRRGYVMEIDFNISVKEFVEGLSFSEENLSVSVAD